MAGFSTTSSGISSVLRLEIIAGNRLCRSDQEHTSADRHRGYVAEDHLSREDLAVILTLLPSPSLDHVSVSEAVSATLLAALVKTTSLFPRTCMDGEFKCKPCFEQL